MRHNKLITVALIACATASAFAETVSVDTKGRLCASQLAVCVTNWLEKYNPSVGFKIEKDGTDIYVRGSVGVFPSLFSKYDIVIDLDSKRNEVYCYGYLPTVVTSERRKNVVEFLFRAECEYGLSPATLVLTDDGLVRSQSWTSFKELADVPEKALPRLMGSVMEKLYACSQAIGWILLGETKDDIISLVRPTGLFGKEYESSTDTLSADTDLVLKNCFGDNGWKIDDKNADVWYKRRFSIPKGSASFINGWMTDVKKDIGGIYDRLDYTLIVQKGQVCSVCPLPGEVSHDKLAEVADAVMHINQSLRYALFGVDFDNGKVWCHYSLPASMLRNDADNDGCNVYQMHIKTMTTSTLAKNSAAISAKAGLVIDDGKSETMLIPLEEAESRIDSIVKTGAVGGRPLPPSCEPFPLRYAHARQDFIDKKLGFTRKEWKPFPQLAHVKNWSGLESDLVEQFYEKIREHVAQFPDGEIRWTDNGTNGLSITENDLKIRNEQIKFVKESMKGKAVANEINTLWKLNDDFLFGYAIGLNEKLKDALSFVLFTRKALGDAPAEVAIVIEYMPSKLVLDSIVGSFHGDETARDNMRLLKEAGLITVVTE